jgi:signal transduction histidine kinase
MQISIRAKILVVLSVLLLGAIFAYLILAERVFREDKQLLVFDANRTNVERLAAGFESSFHRVVDKLDILAKLLAAPPGSESATLGRRFFQDDPEILEFVLERSGKKIVELFDEAHLKDLGLSKEQLRGAAVLSGLREAAGGEALIENRSLPEAILYAIAVPVVSTEARGVMAYAIIDGSHWQNEFQAQGLALNFATTRDGRILAHPRASLVAARTDLSAHPLFVASRDGKFVSQQTEFEDGGSHFLGVYRKTGVAGVIVYSATDRGAALAASRLLLEKTIVLSLIIVTIVLLTGLWFSDTLTRPIARLVAATDELAAGRFEGAVTVESRDEIGTLANAFSRMAREIREYSRGLEEKVRTRTRELEDKNVAIKEQQEALLSTTRLASIGEIAGQAAHEVLNPLTGMIARLEGMARRLQDFRVSEYGPTLAFNEIVKAWRAALKEGGYDALLKALREPSLVLEGKTMLEEDVENLLILGEQIEAFGSVIVSDIQILLSESFRISRILEDMLAMARVQKETAEYDVGLIARDCARAAEDMLRRNGIEIETEIAPGLFARVNADEMRQVFSNLIKNSMDAHARRIRVTGQKEGERVVLRFWDNGEGVAPENRARIFEAHFSTKGMAGSGVGLSISRRLVRAVGGELVLATSEPGRETEFEISIPWNEENGPG